MSFFTESVLIVLYFRRIYGAFVRQLRRISCVEVDCVQRVFYFVRNGGDERRTGSVVTLEFVVLFLQTLPLTVVLLEVEIEHQPAHNAYAGGGKYYVHKHLPLAFKVGYVLGVIVKLL